LSFSRLRGASSQTTSRRWLRDPGFAQRIAKACDLRDDPLAFQIWMTPERTPPGPVREMNRSIGPLLRQQSRLRPGSPKGTKRG
jgi:hypothetical protein